MNLCDEDIEYCVSVRVCVMCVMCVTIVLVNMITRKYMVIKLQILYVDPPYMWVLELIIINFSSKAMWGQ